MPACTAIALDRLLEPGSWKPTLKPPPVPGKLEKTLSAPTPQKSIPRPPQASPALYATPESTPLPDSPSSASSFPPSPYIINHKRRGPRLLKSLSQNDVGGAQSPSAPFVQQKVEVADGKGVEEAGNGIHDRKLDGEQKIGDLHSGSREPVLEVADGKGVEEAGNGIHDKKLDGEQKVGNLHRCSSEPVATELLNGKLKDAVLDEALTEANGAVKPAVDDSGREGENDDFFDLQDSLSTASNTEVDERWKPGTPLGEYYDAFEDISSEGASRSSGRNVEEELREMRLNVLMEIERRKQAEEALEDMQNQWQRLSHHLSLVGLKLPAPPTMTEDGDVQSDADPVEELCQQVVIARYVAGAIARGCSRAEVELEMEPQIESKNFEIARLWDRLHYYEAANREMSQRNQEAVEMARQQRHRRKRRQKWIWCSIGVAVSLGAAAIAWSYLPVSKPSSTPEGEASASLSTETLAKSQ